MLALSIQKPDKLNSDEWPLKRYFGSQKSLNNIIAKALDFYQKYNMVP